MKSKKVFYILSFGVGLLIVWFIYESFNHPGVGQLSGEFKEMAFYRNENNTGPVKRVYAVYTSTLDWKELEQYGKFMPHTKYGTTVVYFFTNEMLTPRKLNSSKPHFDIGFNDACVAVFEKNAMGQESFTTYPFK